MKNTEITIYIFLLLIPLFFTSCNIIPQSSTEELDKRIIINDTDQNLLVYIGSLGTNYNEYLLTSVQANDKSVISKSFTIPNTETDYLIIAKTNNIVFFTQRYPASFFQNVSWTITIPTLSDSNTYPLTINNSSGKNITIYVGIWNGISFSTAPIEVPIGKKTINNSHIILADSDFCRILAVSSEDNRVIFSQWYTLNEFESINWQIEVPAYGILWDGYESFNVDNRTNSELKIYVNYGDDIWYQEYELSIDSHYTYIGSIGSLTTVFTGQRWINGSSSWGYLAFIKAINTAGETVFLGILSPHTKYSENKLVIEPN
jgi:hypothetical protein